MTIRPAQRSIILLLGAGLLAACSAAPATLDSAPVRMEPPPGDVLSQPGPNAENELDPALLADLPPQARRELGLNAASGTQADGNTVGSKVAPAATRGTPARKSATSPPNGKAVKIASIAVTEVKGAPGKGNAELARALRLVLRKAGLPVHARARRDSMTISGRVELGPKTPRGQRVRLKWTARAPNGKLLGVIDQSNIVPSGSLDKGFGPAALPAAEGAAEGIFRLLRRLQRG